MTDDDPFKEWMHDRVFRQAFERFSDELAKVNRRKNRGLEADSSAARAAADKLGKIMRRLDVFED